jgi:hypothetical protein
MRSLKVRLGAFTAVTVFIWRRKTARTSKTKLLLLCRSWILVLVACVITITAVLRMVDVGTDSFNLVLVLLLLSLLLLIVVVIVVIVVNVVLLLSHRLYYYLLLLLLQMLLLQLLLTVVLLTRQRAVS